jgi:hypothetical protein
MISDGLCPGTSPDKGMPCSRRRRASPDYGRGGGDPSSHRRAARAAAPASPHAATGPQYIVEFTAAHPGESDSESDSGSIDAGGGCVAGGGVALEAVPGRIDPAAAGGPVALPAAGSVMRGRREFTARDHANARSKEAADRARITMNVARVAAAPAAAGAGAARQDRLKRLMAAQFNSSVARDTKRVLERRAREDEDRRAREAIERSALALPRAPADPKLRGADRRECAPSWACVCTYIGLHTF